MSEEVNILQPGEEIRPNVTIDKCRSLIKDLYEFECDSITELIAYDDKNYKVIVKKQENVKKRVCSDGYVLKIVNKLDSRKCDLFEAQTKLLLYLDQNGIKCPKPVRNKNEEYYSLEWIENSGKHVVRLLEYLPGHILYDVPTSPDLFYNVGKYLSTLNSILKNFHHEAFESNQSLWMLDSAPQIRKFLYVITNVNDQQMIEDILTNFETNVLEKRHTFEKGTIHGDFNEHNIVCKQSNGNVWYVDSILDFGDAQYSCLLFDLAIALAYMIIQANDFESAGYFLLGYQTIRTVPNHEYELLKVCIAARFCQSLVMGMYTYSKNPDNEYVLTTQTVGWTLLRQLWQMPSHFLYNRWKQISDTQNC